MRTYFITARVYRKDQHYWTVGILVHADSLGEAVSIFTAWACGISTFAESVVFSSIIDHKDCRNYQKITDPTLAKEIREFINEDQTRNDEKRGL